MSVYVYAIAIAQFLLGALITVFNGALWMTTAVTPGLRTASHCLLGNMWFANLLLGIIVAVSNVEDLSETYVFQKTEGTVAIVNGFITIAMLLTLVTDRLMAVRRPHRQLSTKTSLKIIAVTWAVVLSLTLIKAIVFGLSKIGTPNACFECFLSFEVTSLVIFTVVTLCIYFASIYLICIHRNRTVGDSSAPLAINYEKEYKAAVTTGYLLFGFSITFLAFVLLIATWLADRYAPNLDAAEVIITLFYSHSVINPIIMLVRDVELRLSVLMLVRCQRPPTVNVHPPSAPSELPPAVTVVNGNSNGTSTTVVTDGFPRNRDMPNNYVTEQPPPYTQLQQNQHYMMQQPTAPSTTSFLPPIEDPMPMPMPMPTTIDPAVGDQNVSRSGQPDINGEHAATIDPHPQTFYDQQQKPRSEIHSDLL